MTGSAARVWPRLRVKSKKTMSIARTSVRFISPPMGAGMVTHRAWRGAAFRSRERRQGTPAAQHSLRRTPGFASPPPPLALGGSLDADGFFRLACVPPTKRLGRLYLLEK